MGGGCVHACVAGPAPTGLHPETWPGCCVQGLHAGQLCLLSCQAPCLEPCHGVGPGGAPSHLLVPRPPLLCAGSGYSLQRSSRLAVPLAGLCLGCCPCLLVQSGQDPCEGHSGATDTAPSICRVTLCPPLPSHLPVWHQVGEERQRSPCLPHNVLAGLWLPVWIVPQPASPGLAALVLPGWNRLVGALDTVWWRVPALPCSSECSWGQGLFVACSWGAEALGAAGRARQDRLPWKAQGSAVGKVPWLLGPLQLSRVQLR